jgi:putative polyketide hydroxylase
MTAQHEAGAIERVPVLVIGTGPAGLMTALTLARAGVRNLLVERHGGINPLPRATGVSTRTMELVRAFGLEAAARAGEVPVRRRGGLRTWTLALAHQGVLSPFTFPDPEIVAAVSPSAPAIIPQDHLETVMLGALRARPEAEVAFDTELAAFDQDDSGVTAVLRSRTSGALRTVRADYLVGADGAHSTVRAGLGIEMTGPDHLSEIATVLFEAPLDEVVGEDRYGLYAIFHSEAAGVLVPSGAGRWLYGREWDPRHETLDDYPESRLVELIRLAAGVPDLDVRVLRTGHFSFAAQVAERFRDGRVVLIGDAAHRMTPRGGRGMNTAIHDADALGWRLAWILKGWAGPGLLDGYEPERRPIAERNVAFSAQEEPDFDVRRFLAEDLDGRLPHAWVAEGVSTLDLLGPGLTLLTGPDWPEAQVTGPVPVTVTRLDRAAAEVVGAGAAGAVLVRPDAHIAWRSGGDVDLAEAVAALTPAMSMATTRDLSVISS